MLKVKTELALFGFLLLFLTSLLAFAQQADEIGGGKMLPHLKERLKLTDDQSTQLQPIIKKQGEELRAAFQQYKDHEIPGLQALRAEIQRIREAAEKQLGGILTVDQMKEYKAFQDEFREKMQQKIKDNMFAALAKRLKLTPEQEAQVRPLVQENIEKSRELLQQYQGQGRKAMQDFRQAHQQLQQETEARLGKILTVEQLNAYKTFQKEQRQKIAARIRARRGQ